MSFFVVDGSTHRHFCMTMFLLLHYSYFMIAIVHEENEREREREGKRDVIVDKEKSEEVIRRKYFLFSF